MMSLSHCGCGRRSKVRRAVRNQIANLQATYRQPWVNPAAETNVNFY